MRSYGGHLSGLHTLKDLLGGASIYGVHLFARDSSLARSYLSRCLQLYDEYVGRGLRSSNPVTFLEAQGWGALGATTRVELPARLEDGGGTRLDELLLIAVVTRALAPRTVFEIGTFKGRTTSVFALNAPHARILTLDLPPDEDAVATAMKGDYIASDIDLVRSRTLASWVHALGLQDRVQQIHCDSLQFDPSPYLRSVDLGFIDGAHARKYVENDTAKMALMMTDCSLVLWHDYGGKGSFRGLSEYLEDIARQVPVYRVPGTSLAWASGHDLRRLMT
jgi:predicted O-methyltransferase YrrM